MLIEGLCQEESPRSRNFFHVPPSKRGKEECSMKKSLLLFALVLLLAGCASTGNQAAPAGGTPAGSPSEEPGLTAGAPEKMTCRIVDGAEEGELVLAGPGLDSIR